MIENKQELNRFKPVSEEFEFRHFPFYWLMKVANSYSNRMEKHLKKVGLNTTTWRILMILRENGTLSVTEIATHAVVKTPTITKAAYKLQEEQLLEIFTNANDARVSMMKLTSKGRTTVDEVIAATAKVFDRAYEGFSIEEIDDLNAKLNRLFTNLDNA